MSHVATKYVSRPLWGVLPSAKRPEGRAARGRPGNVWQGNVGLQPTVIASAGFARAAPHACSSSKLKADVRIAGQSESSRFKIAGGCARRTTNLISACQASMTRMCARLEIRTGRARSTSEMQSCLLSLHNPVARAARALAGRYTHGTLHTRDAVRAIQASRAAREGLYWFSNSLAGLTRCPLVRFSPSLREHRRCRRARDATGHARMVRRCQASKTVFRSHCAMRA